ncbi:hypothetical protein EMCRGX_G019619 [Ephydatia muelleri]
MPSRNRKKRATSGIYLQKQEDILSQENTAERATSYKADTEKKKASVRDSYKADPEKKKASVRDSYKADPEKKKASESVYWNDPAVRLAKHAAERKRYRSGHRTTTTTQSYSLYEPKSHALMEYNGGLEKAIRRDSELPSEVNDVFYAVLPPYRLLPAPAPPPAPVLAPVPPPPLRLLPPPPSWLPWPEPGCRVNSLVGITYGMLWLHIENSEYWLGNHSDN